VKISALGLALLVLTGPQTAAPTQDSRPSFAEWLDGIRAEALARGVRQEVVDQALSDIAEPLPVVIERDRAQAETVLPLETYITRQMSAERLRAGRERLQTYKEVLARIGHTYGVQPEIIIAIWGLESNYGRFSGVRPTVAALATLAWDPRRSTLFRNELFDALTILDHGDIAVDSMRGSWAGAMGQPQFMPSSYLKYAEDFDGDGRRDIWASAPDVFASIANYLKGNGWHADEPWGREVRIPAAAARTIATTIDRRNGSCAARRDMTVSLPLTRWRELGILTTGGSKLPAGDRAAALVSGKTRRFLVYDNYDTLLEYNCAHAYAITVGLLANQIASPPPAATASTPARARQVPR
jgi:membrane-bound lytic murein transglycosylase B